jgi:very-short-patch-repair endonuclease
MPRSRAGNKFMNKNMQTKEYTKSEVTLYKEIIENCMEGDSQGITMQYQVNDLATPGKTVVPIMRPILDIAIPDLKIAIRVMGEVHGMPWAQTPHDEIQGIILEYNGWTVIDVWHSERADLWT